MSTWSWEGHDAGGRTITGTVEAPSFEDAAGQLRARGVYVINMEAGAKLTKQIYEPPKRTEIAPYEPPTDPNGTVIRDQARDEARKVAEAMSAHSDASPSSCMNEKTPPSQLKQSRPPSDSLALSKGLQLKLSSDLEAWAEVVEAALTMTNPNDLRPAAAILMSSILQEVYDKHKVDKIDKAMVKKPKKSRR